MNMKVYTFWAFSQYYYIYINYIVHCVKMLTVLKTNKFIIWNFENSNFQ